MEGWAAVEIIYDSPAPASADVEELAHVYRESGLAERRPVENVEQFTAMIRNAGLIVVARDDGRAVGVVRCLTDRSYAT